MKLTAWSATALLLLTSVARAAESPAPITLPLLPGDPPAGAVAGEKVDQRKAGDKPITFISNVQWPTLTVYLPEKAKATGAAVVICPGGGYGGVAIDLEGDWVAQWLNSVGVAGVVLKYRMPRPAESKDALPYPVADARRAMRTVRANAAAWGVDPARVGILGFSAGGHLAATTATQWEDADPAAADPLARYSTRPDFAVLAYPVITFVTPAVHSGSKDALLGKGAVPKRVESFSAELRVTAQTPPTFLVHAKDDPVKVQNSELFAAACKAAGVPVELVTFEKGGHGFGLGVKGGEPATWPATCAAWMKARGLLDKK
ncbi:MAG: axeA1 2 [Phycisphaerales bacterium]|nr:axeA1 2 [Phycisphaerales bacterium]